VQDLQLLSNSLLKNFLEVEKLSGSTTCLKLPKPAAAGQPWQHLLVHCLGGQLFILQRS